MITISCIPGGGGGGGFMGSIHSYLPRITGGLSFPLLGNTSCVWKYYSITQLNGTELWYTITAHKLVCLQILFDLGSLNISIHWV